MIVHDAMNSNFQPPLRSFLPSASRAARRTILATVLAVASFMQPCIAINITHWTNLTRSGIKFQSTEKLDEAEHCFVDALQEASTADPRSPMNTISLQQLGDAYFAHQKFGLARQCYQREIAETEGIACRLTARRYALYHLALICIEQRHYSHAEALLIRNLLLANATISIEQEDPSPLDVLAVLAVTQFLQSKDNQARETISKLVNASKEYSPRVRIKLLVAAGGSLAEKEKLIETPAFKRNLDNAAVTLFMSALKEIQKQPKRGSEAELIATEGLCRASVDIAPVRAADMLSASIRAFERASPQFKCSIPLAHAKVRRGIITYGLKDYQQAAIELQDGLQALPPDISAIAPTALYASVLHKLHRTQQASAACVQLKQLILKHYATDMLKLSKCIESFLWQTTGPVLDTVLELCRYTLARDPERARQCDIPALAGATLSLQGRPQEALSYLAKASSASDRTSLGLEVSASCHVSLQQYAKALQDIDEAARLNPAKSYATMRGTVYSDMQRYHEALKCFTNSLDKDPGDETARMYRAGCYLRLREFERAAADAAACPRPAVRCRLFADLAAACMAKEPGLALTCLTRALAACPDDLDLIIRRAQLYATQGKEENALADCNTAISKGARSADCHALRGNLLATGRHLNEALADYSRGLALDPHHAPSHWGRAGVYLYQQHFDLALGEFNTAISLMPSNAQLYARRAETLAAMRDTNKALLDCKRAIKLSPADSSIRLVFARTLMQAHQQSLAVEQCHTALKLQPSSEEALALLNALSTPISTSNKPPPSNK